MRDQMWYGEKTYKDRPARRPRKPVAKLAPTFAERKAGDDPVQDIIDAAECIRRAHPSYRDADPLVMMPGGVRIFWALMLEAARQATGQSLDDVIGMIRAQAARPPEASQDRGENQ